jgi:flagellar biosynthetic protein FliR
MENILLYLPNFLLVFCRIGAFFVVAPVFSSRNIPVRFKIGLTFFVTLILLASLGGAPIGWSGDYLLSIFKETLVGLLLGFVAFMFFTVVQIAGSFIDMQMGFGMANIIDPMTGAQSPMMGNLKFMLAVLLFLSVNGHHLFLMAIMNSYQWVPLSSDVFTQVYNGHVSEFLMKTFAVVFLMAFQMAAPLVAAMFLVDAGLGILARTAPQFTIFVIGMPLKVLVGFLILIVFIPTFVGLFSELFQAMFQEMQKLLSLLAGNGS